MSQAVPQSPNSGPLPGPPAAARQPGPLAPEVTVALVKPELRLAAATRLVSQELPDREQAALRLLTQHSPGPLDFSLMFAATEQTAAGPPLVRQACLIVPSSGRTGAVFISEAPPGGDPGGPAAAAAERSACLRAAAEHVARERADAIRILQALPEADELWSTRALQGAEFVTVGELLYLRRPMSRSGVWGKVPPEPRWPAGVRVRPLSELGWSPQRRDPELCAVLDRTYEQTLDCPALCGMRETRDILASHLAVGRFDPALWFLIFDGDRAGGCMLLSPCPDQHVAELVYVGVSPALRGRGIGRPLMDLALRRCRMPGIEAIVCAVDRTNRPAVKVYDAAGFRAISRRGAWVRPIR